MTHNCPPDRPPSPEVPVGSQTGIVCDVSQSPVPPSTPRRSRILKSDTLDSEIQISIRTPLNVSTTMSITVTPSKPKVKETSDSDDGGSPTPTSRHPRAVTPTPHKSPHRPRGITPMSSPSHISFSQSQAPTPSIAQLSDDITTSLSGDPPVIDNRLLILDGPEPVYPRGVGVTHLEDPLPMIPRHPKKYYNIYRGLKIGIFYDTWNNLDHYVKHPGLDNPSWGKANNYYDARSKYNARRDKKVLYSAL